MGKRILVQRKGHGHLWAQCPSHRYTGEVRYRPFKNGENGYKFKVIELMHAPGRMTPVARIKYEDGTNGFYLTPEGIFVGDEFVQAKTGELKVGNILPLKEIPLGALIFNIESVPGAGGQFMRASGVAAIVRNKAEHNVQVMFRSRKERWFNENCLCTLGVTAGGGRVDKPLLKAGASFYRFRSKAYKWPVVRGAAMNACDHPFGGGRHKHPHIPTTTARTAPPGRKVGLIAARRTGRKKV